MTTKQGGFSEDHRITRAAQYTSRAYSGDVTEADRLALESWLSESDENCSEYQEMLNTWDFMDELSGRLDEFEPVAEQPARRWPKLAAAAGVLLAVAVAVSMILPDQTVTDMPKVVSYATDTGEQRTITLDDGSVAVLNTNSRLLIDYSDTRRRAILERGEVFLEVAKEPSRPFVVNAGSRSITVLGTRFSVLKSGLDLEVSVVEGAVAVHRTEQRVTVDTPAEPVTGDSVVNPAAPAYRIEKGISARFSGVFASASANIETGFIENPDKFPYWRYGSIRFNDRPLYQVVKELNRYTQKKVLIEDSRVMHIKVSGVFQLDTVESVLHKMERVLPLKITQYPDRIVIVKR